MLIDTHVTADAEAFAKDAARFIEERMRAAIAQHGNCTLGLSGGKTPRAAFTILGRSETIDWPAVTLFLIDERYVPADDERSNQRLLMDTLLKTVTLPCVFPDTALPLEKCVADYDRQLSTLFGDAGPDLIVLGLGDDGHTSSLFPPVPPEGNGDRLVIHTTTDHFDVHDRISTTLPLLRRSGSAVFLLQGEGKKGTWDAMMASAEGWERWPAKEIIEYCPTTLIAQW